MTIYIGTLGKRKQRCAYALPLLTRALLAPNSRLTPLSLTLTRSKRTWATAAKR